MQSKSHWDHAYSTKATNTEEYTGRSLILISGTGVPSSSPIIDVGGGASAPVDDLLANRYPACRCGARFPLACQLDMSRSTRSVRLAPYSEILHF